MVADSPQMRSQDQDHCPWSACTYASGVVTYKRYPSLAFIRVPDLRNAKSHVAGVSISWGSKNCRYEDRRIFFKGTSGCASPRYSGNADTNRLLYAEFWTRKEWNALDMALHIELEPHSVIVTLRTRPRLCSRLKTTLFGPGDLGVSRSAVWGK